MGPLHAMATRLASWLAPPYYGRSDLARWSKRGFISHNALIHHGDLRLGKHVLIDDRVLIFQDREGGSVDIGDSVHLWRDTIIQTGRGGCVKIGRNTRIQPRCQFSAYKGRIQIGSNVAIAPNCAFYSYDHGMLPNEPIHQQTLQTKGGIRVGDEVWIGVNVVILDGVRIGKGAVIGAGSVVTRSIPDNAIAVGVPARVVRLRGSSDRNQETLFATAASRQSGL